MDETAYPFTDAHMPDEDLRGMQIVEEVTRGDDRVGVVFFDDAWDAYGYRTAAGPNGPFDSAAEAREALDDELGA